MAKALNKKRISPAGVIYGVIVAAMAMAFVHADLMESANHAWVLLDCTFSGRFFDFYNVVTEHSNALYYINGAHYNILFYILYALWELPVWLICRIWSLPLNEGLLWMWAKGPAVISAVGCGFLVQRILEDLGFEDKNSKWAVLLNPVMVLFAVCAGQYDSICLVLMLLALRLLQRKRNVAFYLVMGVAACFKFFALPVLLPWLLLKHKKPLPIVVGGAVAVAPWLATTALFLGRTGNSGNFTATMLQRLFETRVGNIPLFPAVYVLVLMVCWMRPYKNTRQLISDCAAAGFAVFGAMALLVNCNPQWLVLSVPFWVLLAGMQNNKTLYYCLSAAFYAGVLVYSLLYYPAQFELNLILFGGVWAFRILPDIIFTNFVSVADIVGEIATLKVMLEAIPPCAFILAQTAFLPLGKENVSLADRWVKERQRFSQAMLWLVFCGCFAVHFAIMALQLLIK